MIRISVAAIIALIVAATASAAESKPLAEFDFENDTAIKSQEKQGVTIAQPGFQSEGAATRKVKGKYCQIYVRPEIEMTDGLTVSFDAKIDQHAGKVSYLALTVYTADKQKVMIQTVKPPSDWKHLEFEVAKMRVGSGSKVKEPLKPGEKIGNVVIYSRAVDKVATETEHTLTLDNVRFYTK